MKALDKLVSGAFPEAKWLTADWLVWARLIAILQQHAFPRKPSHESSSGKENIMKIKEIETTCPHCISPDATLMEAAADMKSLDVGILPVCDNDVVTGAITDRDITIRAVAEGKDPRTTRIRDVMSHKIVYCFDEQDVDEAAEIMEKNRVRRLPVLNQCKRLVGILSLGDLAIRTEANERAGRVLARVSTSA
jgi:CBS domain-containing protein